MKNLLVNRGWKHLLLLLSLTLMVPSARAYYIESDYPAVSSVFYSEMPASGGYLSLQAMNGGTGTQPWFSIPAGQTVIIRMLIPPGVNIAAINGDTTWAGSTFLNVFETYRSTVEASDLRALTVGMSETLYQGTELTAPVYRYLVIKNAAASTFAFGNVTVMMNVANASTYNTWRATLSTPSATFSVTPDAQTIAAGSLLTLSAQNGTIAICTSSDTAKIPNPTVSSTATSASATVAANASAGTVTLSCTSAGTTPITASATVSVTVPDFSITANSLQIVQGANYTLTAHHGTIQSCASNNSAAFTAPDVATNGATATGIAVTNAPVGSQATITCLAAAGGTGSVTLTVSATPQAGATIVSNASGGLAALSLSTTITPASYHTGTGNYYIVALIPNTVIPPFGALAFFQETAGWAVWTGGAFLPYKQGSLGMQPIAIANGINLTSFADTEIYAGYSSGSDYVLKKICTLSSTAQTGCQ